MNPLRPYYIPPTIGPPAEALNKTSPSPNPFSQGRNVTASGRYATKARDMFSDLEYKEYLGDPSPSVVQNVKDLIEELMWKYTSVLMAQPFEVAKTILQVRNQDENAALISPAEPEVLRKRTSVNGSSIYDVSWPRQHCALSPLIMTPSTKSQTRTATSQHTLPRTYRALLLPRTRGVKMAADPRLLLKDRSFRSTTSLCAAPTPFSRLSVNCGGKRARGASGRGRMQPSCTRFFSPCWRIGPEASSAPSSTSRIWE